MLHRYLRCEGQNGEVVRGKIERGGRKERERGGLSCGEDAGHAGARRSTQDTQEHAAPCLAGMQPHSPLLYPPHLPHSLQMHTTQARYYHSTHFPNTALYHQLSTQHHTYHIHPTQPITHSTAQHIIHHITHHITHHTSHN